MRKEPLLFLLLLLSALVCDARGGKGKSSGTHTGKTDTVFAARYLTKVKPDDQSKVINGLIKRYSGTGKVFFFRKGHYYLHEPVHLDYSNLSIIGEQGTVFVVTADIYALLANPADMVANMRLEGFTVLSEGYGANNGGLVQINKVRNLQVRHVNIIGVNFDSTFKRTNGFAISQKTSGVIEHLYVEGMPKPGIYVSTYADSVLLRHCIARKMKGYYRVPGDFNPSTGFAITGCTNIIMENCMADSNAGTGLTINITAFPGKNVAPRYVFIKNSVFDHNSRRGLFIASTDTTAREVPEHITLEHCSFSNNLVGIELQAVRHAVFTGTKLYKNAIAVHAIATYINDPYRRLDDISFDSVDIIKQRATESALQIGNVRSLKLDHVNILGETLRFIDNVQKHVIKFAPDAGKADGTTPEHFSAKHVRYNNKDVNIR